jgi:serine protease Do
LDVISASLTFDATAELYAPNGQLVQFVAAGIELTRLPPGDAPTNPKLDLPNTMNAKPEVSEPADGAGSAFFVNNTDLVTARHVVDGCAKLTFADGTELELVAQHPTLDLALLSSPRRSRDWIPLHLTGTAKLGQRIIALGYPLYGTLGTALNSTRGNVSALSGIGDDPSKITFTEPIQPGNSGGPLLGLDGSELASSLRRSTSSRSRW